MKDASVPSVHWLAIVVMAVAVGSVALLSLGNGSSQTNVEYFFRLLYDCLNGSCYGSLAGVSAWLAHLWLAIIFIGYAVAVIGLFVIVYAMMRLFELRAREKEFYNTVIPAEGIGPGHNPRWKHVESLMESERQADWREAIMESDIMLDDMLTRQGYKAEGVGEKLKLIEPSDFDSLQDAWEAHKVRNQIAHQGSAFDFSETLARRTIARYEKVFREFEMI